MDLSLFRLDGMPLIDQVADKLPAKVDYFFHI
jgi:hypothetical protein